MLQDGTQLARCLVSREPDCRDQPRGCAPAIIWPTVHRRHGLFPRHNQRRRAVGDVRKRDGELLEQISARADLHRDAENLSITSGTSIDEKRDQGQKRDDHEASESETLPSRLSGIRRRIMTPPAVDEILGTFEVEAAAFADGLDRLDGLSRSQEFAGLGFPLADNRSAELQIATTVFADNRRVLDFFRAIGTTFHDGAD
jgi:hypothetical protein